MSNVSQVDKFVQVLTELFDNFVIIIDDLNQRGLTKMTGLLVDTVKKVAMSRDKHFIIDKFVINTFPYWDNIKSKDDDFFLNNSTKIFGEEYSNDERFNSLKLVFSKDAHGKYLLDEDTRNVIREFLFSLIRISIKYVFEAKGGQIERTEKDGKKQVKISYTKGSEYPLIKVLDVAKTWEVKLF